MTNKGRILLIEDHAQIREVLKSNLESWGYAVWEAMNGLQGLELLKAGCRPNVVISDMVMPGSTGLETFVEIRTLYPGIRFVAMSGGGVHKGKSDLERAKEFGADAILEKPFDMDALEKTVISLMN